MTGDAADVVQCVDRVDGIHVFGATGMALHTAVVDFLGRNILEGKDLSFVAAARNVSCPGTVTGFAALPFRALFGFEGGYEVRGRFVVAVEIFCWHIGVTGLAGFRANILGGF